MRVWPDASANLPPPRLNSQAPFAMRQFTSASAGARLGMITVGCRFAAARFPALHSSDGNSADAFTFIPCAVRERQKEKTGPHDAHRWRRHCSRIFAQVPRQQGILPHHSDVTRPSRPLILPDLLPALPLHL